MESGDTDTWHQYIIAKYAKYMGRSVVAIARIIYG